MAREVFKYSNEKVTVVWQPKLCVHSTICFKGLHEVFDPRKRPWVNIDGASAERIIEQVKKCPSGALRMGNQVEPTPLNTESTEAATEIRVQQGGPLLVTGFCVIHYPDGKQESKQGSFALCRCGGSSNKPYCDGSHNKLGFSG